MKNILSEYMSIIILLFVSKGFPNNISGSGEYTYEDFMVSSLFCYTF